MSDSAQASQLERRLTASTDAQLLEITPRHGDAFSIFYERHLRSILAFLLSRTGNAEVAEELACEVFAAAFIGARTYEPTRGEPRAWLFGIAKITLLRSYNQHAIEQSARLKLGVSVGGYNEDAWERAERRLDTSLPGLQATLERLTDAEREAVEARVVHELSYAEIARDQDASEAAIRQRVSRGMSKLRDLARRRGE
jgi:RNA polymerase sigma-70 factor (ECF subfamily)